MITEVPATRLPETITPKRPLSQRSWVRFASTFLANVFSAALAFPAGVIIARSLNPANYGDLNFLSGSFLALLPLLGMGTTNAFYTFLSRKKQDVTYFQLYFGWLSLQFLGTVLVVGWLLPAAWVERIWLGHGRSTLLLAFGATFGANMLWQTIKQMGEASRKTLLVQTGVCAQAVVHLASVAILAYFKLLTVRVVLALTALEWFVLSLALAPSVFRMNLARDTPNSQSVRSIMKEFVTYCRPLLISTWASFLYAFLDRWLLQRFGGAEQQGFLAISLQFSGACMIVTSSLFMVLWKEMAEAYEHHNLQRMERLCNRVTRTLYFLVCWLSCLLIPYAGEILRWTVGYDYVAARLCLMIMFLYPIHQTFSNIYSMVFLVTGHTKSFTTIAVVMMFLSFPLTYFLIAPMTARIPGLGLGSTGMALRLVGWQLIWSNLYGYVISRKMKWNFPVYFQFVMLGTLLTTGFLCREMTHWLAGSLSQPVNPVWTTTLGALLYAGITLWLILHFPKLLGLSREEINDQIQAFRQEWRHLRTQDQTAKALFPQL